MNNAFWAAALTACVMTMASCGGNGHSGQSGEPDSAQAAAAADAPYADSEVKNTFTTKLAGSTYEITIVRKADKALPVVTDDMGKKFYDNRVDINIARDGAKFFEKSYTKESFASYLAAEEAQGAVLLGMAFDSSKSDSHAIYLGAQVAPAGIAEGPAFSIEIPLDGSSPKIVRDARQDTTGDDSLGD